jgi:predicted site-specific integrase-resolvase
MPKQPAPEGAALLTPAEFGRRIGRSRATVYRLINAGLIETVTLPVAKPGDTPSTGAVRIPLEALEKFSESLRRSA